MQQVAAGKNNRFEIKELLPEEWKELSEKAHLVVFKEDREASMDRIDYALVALEDGKLCGYLTAKELDEKSVYWQFGGAFPGTHSSVKVFDVYQTFIDWTFEHYERVTTLVENSNIRYLKLAMHCGFRIIGCRFFKGQILVELLNERGK